MTLTVTKGKIMETATIDFKAQFEQANEKNIVPYFRNQVLDISLILQFEVVNFWMGFANVELTKTQRKKIAKELAHGADFVVEYMLGENGKLVYCNVISQYKRD